MLPTAVLITAIICAATVAGDCTFRYGYAYELRFGSHISLESNSFLGAHTAFTFSIWLKPYSTVLPKQAIIGSESDEPKRAIPRSNAGLRLLGDGSVVFLAGANFSRSPQARIESNRWTHVAGAFDAAVAGGTAWLYVNGVLAASESSLGPCNVVEKQFFVGRSLGINEDLRLSGLVDEISVWGRALAAPEVASLWRTQLAGTEAGLLMYLTGDGDTEAHAIDRSAAGANRTVKVARGDKIAQLAFFGWRADCVGCFSEQFPRCAPWHSANDTCGDGVITGAEECEIGNTDCDAVTCACPPGLVPDAAGDCNYENSTCVDTANLLCVYAITDCRNSCPCVDLAFDVNCTAAHCSAYDLPLLPTFAWPTCTTQCSSNLSVCFNIIPDYCLRFLAPAQCLNASCAWCTDHCAKGAADCMPRCANSAVDALESCDDGNDAGGDGCSADCLAVETGWNCLIPGSPCATNCSDGITAGAEKCDDGNTVAGDGCFECAVEDGWECDTAAVPSVCTKKPLSTTSIVIIGVAVLALLVLISAGVALIIIYALKRGRWKNKKLPGVIEIALTSIFGAEQQSVMFYDLTQSRMIEAKDFPVKIEPMVLTFGYDETDRAPVDELIADNITLTNEGLSDLYYRVCPQPSQKWLITSSGKVSIPAGRSVSQQIQLFIGATTKIDADVAVVISDRPFDQKIDHRHTVFRIRVESKVSTKLDPDEIELCDPPIGDGSFGTVYRGTYRAQDVAIKVLKFQELGNRRREFEHEIRIMEGLRSPFIVGFCGAVTIPGRLCLVTEFVPLGSLTNLFGKGILNYIMKVRVCLDCARGMLYLHGAKMIHRDLKPDNILVISHDISSMAICKLSDFGSTREVGEEIARTYSKMIGTPVYMAPELLDGRMRHTMNSDVFSYAIVSLQTLTEQDVYQGDEFRNPWQIAKFVTKGNRPTIPGGISGELRDLITQCWDADPAKRPKFDTITEKLMALFQELFLADAAKEGAESVAAAKVLCDALFSSKQEATVQGIKEFKPTLSTSDSRSTQTSTPAGTTPTVTSSTGTHLAVNASAGAPLAVTASAGAPLAATASGGSPSGTSTPATTPGTTPLMPARVGSPVPESPLVRGRRVSTTTSTTAESVDSAEDDVK